MPVPQGGWRLGLHGPGAISHRGIPIPKGDGVLALWPRPHPPLGNTPKGGGVLAFMASASSPTGGNPSPRGMGSWPYGLDPVLHRGTPPRGVASWPSWPRRHLPPGETHPLGGWGLGPMASTPSSTGEHPQGGWRLGLHGLGVISHRGKSLPTGDGVLALWPRPHPHLGNSPPRGVASWPSWPRCHLPSGEMACGVWHVA